MNTTKTVATIGLIADSGCDLTPEMRKQLDVRIIPLKIVIDGRNHYVDDGSVDVHSFLSDMKQSKTAVQSSSPSVGDFADAMKDYDKCFVVTISSQLSGSYQSACIAARIVMEELPDKQIHVFSSDSASAGETALVLFLRKQISEGKEYSKIIPIGHEFIKRSRTLCALKDISNLVRNGRLPKISGVIATALSIIPVLGDNGNGKLRLITKVRGMRKSLSGMIDTVIAMTKHAVQKSITLVLGHCNNTELAGWFSGELLKRCTTLKEVITVPTSALSSMYAGDGGIVISFCQ